MKRRTALFGGVALALVAISPVTQATADDPSPPPGPLAGGNTKSVPKSDSGSYIVVMKADPLVKSIAPEDLDTAGAEAQAAVLEDSHDEVLQESGVSAAAKVQDYTNALNGFSAVLSQEAAEKVAGNPEVALVLPDELRHADSVDQAGGGTTATRDYVLNTYLGLTSKGEAYKSGITGEGVVVGVIDTGIWPEHPSFADDGSYPDLGIELDETEFDACDFGDTAHNANDAPFDCNNKLLGARQILPTYRALIGADPDEFDSARDDNGHGTHTASTAAGNTSVQASIFGRDYGKVSGIAPRARIIAYKALGNLGGFTSDLAAAIDQAVADGVDVINYSIGGGAQLISADALAFLFAADAGVAVAVSAGNSGPGAETIGGPADTPWVSTVGANTQSNVYAGQIKLTGGLTLKGASVTPGTATLSLVDAADAGSELCIPGELDEAMVAGKIVLCKRGQIGRAAKSYAVYIAGGAGMILYNANNVDNLFTDNFWVPTVMTDYTEGVQVAAYIDAKGAAATAQLITGGTSSWKNAPTMAVFSSRGPDPTAADVIKPDITAPGVQILAGASPFPDPGFTPEGELFQAIAGTSMSSPVVAGTLALMTQAHPDWSPAAMKSALMTSANTKVRDNDRVSQATPFAMGAGEVDPGLVSQPGSAFNPGLVYDTDFFGYLGFLCDAAPQIFSNPTATCASLAGAGIPTDASDLNLASIGIAELAGSQTVTRTITSVAAKAVTWKAKVTAPAGYSVVVNPSVITLAPGDTATYEVTITNNGGGTPGEWRFGSLSWSGNFFVANSPIAVKGVQLQAPAEVTSAPGATEASFDVKFGYTGPYSAVAHGLVAATANGGDIGQDPDQTYPSADDTAVGVQTFSYPISGALFARWELPAPSATDDIDLYLLNSNGDVVAQSTNGSGSDEVIEIVGPGDDTYTLVVHGWSVPSAPLAYTVNSWIVPMATGGSLSVVSAPSQAVTGQTATITVGWPAVPAGTREVGVVTHEDGSGIIGVTVVNVDG